MICGKNSRFGRIRGSAVGYVSGSDNYLLYSENDQIHVFAMNKCGNMPFINIVLFITVMYYSNIL